jgi:transglutaminase-like putative cysteine protease
MRHHLLVSIVGIVIIAVALAGLLTELGSLSNPADAQQNENSITLENGSKITFQTYNLSSNSAGPGADSSGTISADKTNSTASNTTATSSDTSGTPASPGKTNAVPSGTTGTNGDKTATTSSTGKTNGTSSNTTGTSGDTSTSLTSSTNNNGTGTTGTNGDKTATTSSTGKTNNTSLNSTGTLPSSTGAANTSASSTTGATNGNSGQTTSAAKTNTSLLFSPGNTTAQCYGLSHTPVFEVSGAMHTGYLRQSVGGEYEDGAWTQVDTKSFDYQALMMLPDAIPLIFSFPWNGLTLSLMTEPQEQSSSLYADTITVKPYTTGQTILPGVVPTSLFLQNVSVNGQFTPETAIFNSSETMFSYSWQSNIYDFSSDQLNEDITINNPFYIQLPSDLPTRVKQLAQQITASATTPYEKAEAIKSYLQTNYTYKFGKDDPLYNTKPPSQDPVDWFLFDHKSGTCGNFSSAFVVLARSIGLPARVVSGWAISATDQQQTVYADQAHQWAEVAFANLGWVTFEATASGGAPSRVADESTTTTTPATTGSTSTNTTTTLSTTTTTASTTTSAKTPTSTIPPTSTTSNATTTSPTTTPNSPTTSTTHSTPTTTATTSTTTTPPIATTPAPGSSQESTITEITSVASVINKGKTFNIIGTVKTAIGTPIDGLSVEIYINLQKHITGGVLVGQGTVTKGSFNISAEIPNTTGLGNYQILAHCLGNDEYAGSWSDPQITVVTDTIITLNIPAQVKASQTVTLQGTLTESDSTPIQGQSIDISLNGFSVNQLVTDENGQFQWEQTFIQVGDNSLEASFPGTAYQLPSSQSADVKVLIPTVLSLQFPTKALANKTIVITGTLFQDKALVPLANQSITLSADGQTIGNALATNQSGVFSLSHAFKKQGIYEIEANFAGNTSFSEAQVKTSLEIDPSGSGRTLVWVLIAIAAIFAVAVTGGFILIRRRKKRSPIQKQPGAQSTPIVQVVSISNKTNGILLKIGFTQIDQAFPDVWGIGDELEITFLLLDRDGIAIAGKPLEIIIGRETLNTVIDGSGTAKIPYTFGQKGEYLIKARYGGPTRDDTALSERRLRIVDYREEIVGLFKDLTTRLREFGVSFAQQATPREIQRAVLHWKEDIPVESLEYSISYFEEADFSTHAVSRDTYKKMYLAQKNISQYEPNKNNNN